MTSKNITIFVVVLIGLFGLMWWGRPAPASQVSPRGANGGTGNLLTAPETMYDFGTISMSDGKVSKTFRVTNPGATDAKLESITTSCMCTAAYLVGPGGEQGPFGMPGHGGPARRVNEIIGAGESRDIRVVYDPNAHGPAGVGVIDRFIYLTEAAGGTLELEIKAVVTP